MTQANFLFCVGAQKAGTTWLYSYFAAHPQVHVQPIKEIHYFNVLWDSKQIGFRRMREKHLASFPPLPKSVLTLTGRFARGARSILATERGDGGLYEDSRRLVEMYASEEPDHAAYRRLMLDGAADKPWVADITPDYSVLGGRRYRQMSDAFPGSKFLYLMRDPVQRMWSHLKMRAEWMCAHVRPGITAGDVLQKVLEGRERHILDRSNYRGTLFALGQLPADRVKYMFYETMFANDAIAGLCRFLGVDFHPGNYNHRVRGGVEVS
ncbi:sulfotransferase [uncultured Paracoccus sp.]|uniref:sulfotransferase family protein n=1 Tax=uncultured Paracoccus sp. TaxID=189685 RepID=UPI0025D07D36|nr:sulfotransferase [uncultured Paracoccus sp.]